MMDWLQQYAAATWELALASAPWLLIGLIGAGLIRTYLSPALVTRWLAGRGGVVRAALLGAPLPLCSCGVIPAAVALRRQGASRGATVSFLISVPETGVDSVAITYALLGPFMTIVRPIAALISAVSAGLATSLLPDRAVMPGLTRRPLAQWTPASAGVTDSGCCASSDTGSPCCDESSPTADAGEQPTRISLRDGMRFAAGELLDEIVLWLVIGLLIAGAVAAFVPADALAQWGGGLAAMLVMLVAGIPMYVCATASTPVAAALLLAGLSPGTVLVFLLAGPATNIATLGVVRREMGATVMAMYVSMIAVTAVACGLGTDAIVHAAGINIAAQVAGHGHLVPHWLAIVSLLLLVLLAIRPVREIILRQPGAPAPVDGQNREPELTEHRMHG